MTPARHQPPQPGTTVFSPRSVHGGGNSPSESIAHSKAGVGRGRSSHNHEPQPILHESIERKDASERRNR